jgi:phage baseplate assembly protein W
MADQSFFWSDVSEFYDKQNDGDLDRDTDIPAIFNSIRNIILTIQGERRMLPTFATNVHGLMFEPIDGTTARLIAEGLLEAIKIWENRIDVTGFDIEPREDDHTYRCKLKFTVLGRDDTQTIDFILTR